MTCWSICRVVSAYPPADRHKGGVRRHVLPAAGSLFRRHDIRMRSRSAGCGNRPNTTNAPGHRTYPPGRKPNLDPHSVPSVSRGFGARGALDAFGARSKALRSLHRIRRPLAALSHSLRGSLAPENRRGPGPPSRRRRRRAHPLTPAALSPPLRSAPTDGGPSARQAQCFRWSGCQVTRWSKSVELRWGARGAYPGRRQAGLGP